MSHAAIPEVLFVAHREEILSQAMRTFRRIRPLARLGRYDGNTSSDAEVLFASIQTLSRRSISTGLTAASSTTSWWTSSIMPRHGDTDS